MCSFTFHEGINPVKDLKHRDYISNFCDDFEQQLQHWMQEAITARDQDDRVNPLVEEVTQHARFCQEKCRNFYGRQDALMVWLSNLFNGFWLIGLFILRCWLIIPLTDLHIG